MHPGRSVAAMDQAAVPIFEEIISNRGPGIDERKPQVREAAGVAGRERRAPESVAVAARAPGYWSQGLLHAGIGDRRSSGPGRPHRF